MTSTQSDNTHTNTDHLFSELPWKLIVPLGALGLVRTIPGIIGSEDPLWVSNLVLLPIVTAIWVGIVVLRHVPHPFVTLVCTGGMYGVWAIALNVAIQGNFSKFSHGQVGILGGVVALLVVNLIWGAIACLIVVGIRRLQT
jgi:uncharacterized membrane protein